MHLSLQIDRRVALHGIMALLGATAVAGCGYLPGSDARTTLTEGQLKLLDLVADTIIPATDTPGAVEAGVPKRLAAMYTDWASDETREALSGALDRIEQAHGRPPARISRRCRRTSALPFCATTRPLRSNPSRPGQARRKARSSRRWSRSPMSDTTRSSS